MKIGHPAEVPRRPSGDREAVGMRVRDDERFLFINCRVRRGPGMDNSKA